MAGSHDPNVQDLLERIDLDRPFDDLVREVARSFSLGKPRYYDFVFEGYEDVNAVISTDRGKYFLKVFRRDKDIVVIRD